MGSKDVEFHRLSDKVAAAVTHLDDGEEWSDIVTFRMRRDEAMSLSVIVFQQLEDMKEVIGEQRAVVMDDNADILSRLGAALLGERMEDTFSLAVCGHAAMGVKIAPKEQRAEIAEHLELARQRARTKEQAQKEQESK